jgi:pimeloyl-ACP methyl ester carboxylesterase
MARETWVLLRGLAREAGHWGPFLPAMTTALPDTDVLALDLPGAGTRLGDTWPESIGAAMEMVRSEARSRATPGAPLVLFGVSLGGMIVTEWAARHPGELSGVAVGASSAGNVSPFWKRMRPRGLFSIAMGALARDPETRQARVAPMLTNRRDLRDELVRSWAEIERQRPVSRATVAAQLTAARRWRAPASLEVPALFLVGRGDRLVDPDCTRQLAQRYSAPVVEHADAGHDLTTDATDWVVEELLRFRARLRLGPS